MPITKEEPYGYARYYLARCKTDNSKESTSSQIHMQIIHL